MKTYFFACALFVMVGVDCLSEVKSKNPSTSLVPELKVVMSDVVELFLVPEGDASEYGGLGVCGVFRKDVNLLVRQMHKSYHGQVIVVSLNGSRVWHITKTVAHFVPVQPAELSKEEVKSLGTMSEPASFMIPTPSIHEASDLLEKLRVECMNAKVRK
jgi:hypothetical protein